jgi:hypothetical protein
VLFNKDKTYAPDAAEKIAMLLYGKQTITAQAETIGDIVKKISNTSVTQATEKILLRSDMPPVQTGVPASNAREKLIQELTSWLPQKQR